MSVDIKANHSAGGKVHDGSAVFCASKTINCGNTEAVRVEIKVLQEKDGEQEGANWISATLPHPAAAHAWNARQG